MVLYDDCHDVVLAMVKSPLLAPEPDANSASPSFHSRSRGSEADGDGADTAQGTHTPRFSRVSMAFEDRLEALAREEMTEFLQVLGLGGGDAASGKGLQLLEKRSGVIGGSGRPEPENPFIRLKRQQQQQENVAAPTPSLFTGTPSAKTPMLAAASPLTPSALSSRSPKAETPAAAAMTTPNLKPTSPLKAASLSGKRASKSAAKEKTTSSRKTPNSSVTPTHSPRLQLKTAEGTRHDLTVEDDEGAGGGSGETAEPGKPGEKSQPCVAEAAGERPSPPDADADGIGGDIVLGSLADIAAELRAEVPVDLTPIDKFLKTADELEERLKPFTGALTTRDLMCMCLTDIGKNHLMLLFILFFSLTLISRQIPGFSDGISSFFPHRQERILHSAGLSTGGGQRKPEVARKKEEKNIRRRSPRG